MCALLASYNCCVGRGVHMRVCREGGGVLRRACVCMCVPGVCACDAVCAMCVAMRARVCVCGVCVMCGYARACVCGMCV